MGPFRHSCVLALCLSAVNEPVAANSIAAANSVVASNSVGANPIRRVVLMLQMMGKKVEIEGKREQELFDKFMCYCDTGKSDLQRSIDAAEAKIPQLQSSIEEGTAERASLATELQQGQADMADAKESLAKATGIREKQAQAFETTKNEGTANIEALGNAIVALERGMSGAFLQTKAATILRSLTVTTEMSASDRDLLSSFLQEKQGSDDSDEYAPQGGEITGMLKQMKETMETDLADDTAAEDQAKVDFDNLSRSKNDQISSLTQLIETKTARDGEVGVELVNLNADLDDTSSSLASDKQFFADLSKNCGHKREEWATRQKTRSAELLAISDTIKILNDDDALNLFKNTLPTPPASFLQVQMMSKMKSKMKSEAQLKKEALTIIQGANNKKKSMRLGLVQMALRAKKTSFTKILKMIEEMITLLNKEQEDDDKKKTYCRTELDQAEDKLKAVNLAIGDAETAIDEAKDRVTSLTEDITALEAGIKELDSQVANATDTRKVEHDDFVSTLSANSAAVELLGVAKNRLNKFYNPKLYAPPAAPALSSEDSVFTNFGGQVSTPAPGGIAGTGVTALLESIGDDSLSFVQMKAQSSEDGADAPPPPPETFGAYTKQGEEGGGVTALIDSLVADLETEITEMKTDENDAQTEYEDMIKDSGEKRSLDARSITEKEGTKAELQARLHKMVVKKEGLQKKSMDTEAYQRDLHAECDWLLANFDVRKNARAEEVDSLRKATAVLSGADMSFLQFSQQTRRHLRRAF